MSAPPRTPARRLVPSSSSRPTTPSAIPTSPARVRTRVKSEASASPQVKAALALLRKNRPPPSPALDPDQLDPFTTPATGSRAASRLGEDGASGTGGDGEEVGLEWGMKSMASVLEGAKRGGRLNIASRTLVAIPPSAYAALIPVNSSYHPSARAPPTSRITTVNLTISSALEDAAAETTAWYEQTDLVTLNAANNEIGVLEDAIAGFEALQVLDLHNNYLASVPISLAFLDNLTSLNLASNHLSSFPTQILALSSLRDLNLSSNPIRTLWQPDWRTHLTDTVRPPNISPSASPQSDASPDRSSGALWGSFSSPTKQAGVSDAISYRSSAPFPALTTLLLSDNSFDTDTFTADGFELPPRLLFLDLSNNGLSEASLPLEVFGRLERLTTLNLAGNDIADDLFPWSSSSTTSELPLLFPSLRTFDLSRNSIDSLATLETTLLTRVSRPIEWIGLPKPIANLVRAAASRKLPTTPTMGSIREGFEVNVTENLLRLEHARRRSIFPPSASTPVPASVPRKTTNGSAPETTCAKVGPAMEEKMVLEKGEKEVKREAWEIEAESGLLTEGGRRRARAEAARRAREEEERREEGVKGREVEDVVDGVRTLKLAPVEEPPPTTTATPSPSASPARSPSPSPLPLPPLLAEEVDLHQPPSPLPAIVAEADPTDPAAVLVAGGLKASGQLILTSQSLSSLPIPTTGSPPSTLALITIIDLSRNGFASLPLSSIASWDWASSLRSLDVSHNTLSTIDLLSHPDLRLPSLGSLNLSWNQLPSSIVLDGHSLPSPLLSLLATVAPSLDDLDLSYNRLTSTDGISAFLLPSAGGVGGRKLNVRGNQIADVEELCEVAKTLENGAGGTSWRCEELDLQDNEIARLPTTLGFLPLEVQLLVAGNRFRIPRREVYIDGGSRGLLQYLRDRA